VRGEVPEEPIAQQMAEAEDGMVGLVHAAAKSSSTLEEATTTSFLKPHEKTTTIPEDMDDDVNSPMTSEGTTTRPQGDALGKHLSKHDENRDTRPHEMTTMEVATATGNGITLHDEQPLHAYANTDTTLRPWESQAETNAVDGCNNTSKKCTSTSKGTTCAFPTNAPTGGGTNSVTPNQSYPINDMAHAIGTLQIGHTPNPAHTSPWTLVTAAHKKAPADPTTSHSSQEFGLAFERITKGNNWSTDDLLLILQTIQAHDPKAMLSNADNKTKPTLATAILHKAQKDIPWFTKFTAMKTMTWGKPSDSTTKIVFSFWLTSSIIKKDLAQLRMDSDFTEMLKGTNTYMKVTKLLEPHSKIAGYLLGKDIIHTNRDDITNRLAAHITKYSQTH